MYVGEHMQTNFLSINSPGNGGDLYNTGGSPGTTPEALTVASGHHAAIQRDAADVTGPSGIAGAKAGQYSQNFTGYDSYDRSSSVVKLSAANSAGCAAYSDADKAGAAGKFVWLEWDDNDATRACGSAARANNAQAAGAAGVLLSSSLDNFNAGIAGNAAVPMFQFTGTATAQLRSALNAGTLT